MPRSILIIDDDEKLLRLLKEYLSQFDFTAITAPTPGRGLQLFRELQPQAVVLDVMLPEKDGFAVCREIRAESAIPILMLTARGGVTDRVVGLELGADDYLPKPFEPRELVARLEALLRGRTLSAPKVSPQLRFGELELDVDRREAKLAGKDLELTTTEFEALHLFARNPGRVLSRDEILDQLRGVEWEAFNRSVDVLVSRLRHKLHDDAKKPRYFKTVWGTGYQFLPKREER